MSDIAERLLLDALRDGFRTEAAVTIDDWSDENRILTSDSSAEPGPWRTSRVPYLREPMRALSNTSPWERVYLMFGSQLGKTELGNNWLGYVIDRAAGPFLYVMPTVEMAKDVKRTRLDKMIDASPILRGKVAEAKSRDGGNTLQMLEFLGGFVGLTGANSPASLSSKPIRYVYGDEIDRWPGDSGGEGDPVNLAITRTRTFSRRKVLLTSTPTIKGRSRIEAAFNESARHRFYVPCPSCGFYQELKFPNLKWDKGRPETAHYECQAKGCKIYNHDKTWMLSRGEWRQENPEYTGNAIGFALSSLYSPVGWFSWQEIASMFLEAGKNRDLLKVFVNTVLGEPWDEVYDGVEWEKLYHRREPYELEKVPMGGLILTAGADVQNSWIEVVVRAWGRDKESWVVGHYRLPGNTANISDLCWRQLDELMNRQFDHASGTTLPIRVLAIDTGGTKSKGDTLSHTQVTYNWCRRYPPNRVMPIKGQSSLSVMVGQPRSIDVVMASNGKRRKNALKLWSIGTDIIKAELAGWIRLEPPDPGETHPPGFIHFSEGLEEEFFKGLCSEVLHVSETKTGRKVFEWKPIRDRNEPWDCMVYSRAATAIFQIDKFRAVEWDKLERAICGSVFDRSTPAAQHLSAPQEQPKVAAPAGPRRRRGTVSKGVRL